MIGLLLKRENGRDDNEEIVNKSSWVGAAKMGTKCFIWGG